MSIVDELRVSTTDRGQLLDLMRNCLWKASRSPRGLLAVAVIVMLSSGSVKAAGVDPLSNTYAMSWIYTCQANAPGFPNGSLEYQWWTAKFNSSKKTVSVNVSQLQGDLVVPSNGKGKGFVSLNFNATYAYSNNASTLVIGGQTYNIVYGQLLGTNYQSFLFGGTGGPYCIVSGTALLQQ